MNTFLQFRWGRRVGGLVLLSGWLLATGVSAQTFVKRTGSANPFDGVNLGPRSAPSLGDVDDDGDLDLLVGDAYGDLYYYKNVGTPTAPSYQAQTGSANPLNGLSVGYFATPNLGDVDGDGDLDLLVGQSDGGVVGRVTAINYFRNTGTATAPTFSRQTGSNNPFGALSLAEYPAPNLGDVDGDGDLDLLVGNQLGNVNYYVNTGTATAPAFATQTQTGAANPVDLVSVVFYATPSLGDVDGDGDLDLVVGEKGGGFSYFKNVGTANAPVYQQQTGSANPFNGQGTDVNSTPSLGDVDGDGDLDAVVGNNFGNLEYFENTDLPVITQQPSPTSQSVCVGASTSTTLTATGSEPLTYQWYRNQPDTDEPVESQTNATLSLSNLQLSDAGSYYARVTGPGGSVWSEAFTLTVNAPVFTQAATLNTSLLCAGQSLALSFNVTCPQSASFSAELLKASGGVVANLGNVSPGQNNPLSIPTTTAAGNYQIRVRNGDGTLSSTSPAFTVVALAFTSTPTVSGVPVCVGSAVNVNFNTSCPAGAVFSLQLSNASGSFASPTTLGTFSAGSRSVQIPGDVPAGSSYRTRVVSPGGGPTSNPSAAFRVRACGSNGNSRLAAEVSAEEVGLQVSVSPNPTEGVLRVSISRAVGQALKVELFSTAGHVLRQQGIVQAQSEESLTWDISRQPPGLYLLRVSSEREAKTVKVVH